MNNDKKVTNMTESMQSNINCVAAWRNASILNNAPQDSNK